MPKAPSIGSYTSDPKLGRRFKPLSIGVPSGAGGLDPRSIPNLVGWTDFSDIASLWQDASLTSPITADGQLIKGTTDKSGNNHSFGEGSNAPTYKAGIQNGRSVARFDGTNDQLAVGVWNLAQPFTVFIVAKIVVDEAGVSTEIMDGLTTRVIIYKDFATSKWSYYAGSSQAGSVSADTSYHVHDAVFNGASSSYNVDQASNSTANPGANSLSQPSLAAANGTAVFYNIEVGEILHYSRALTAAERTVLDASLKTKWGTP